jgi:hypothetical protein
MVNVLGCERRALFAMLLGTISFLRNLVNMNAKASSRPAMDTTRKVYKTRQTSGFPLPEDCSARRGNKQLAVTIPPAPRH